MAMNFWEAQRRARTRTVYCITIFIILTLIVAFLAEMAMREFAGDNYDPPLPYLGMAFLGITFAVALFQYMAFKSQGGSYVAETMGGRLIDSRRASAKEQQLLNIVEEVALASSLPVPPVYIIDANEINAFAAGLSSKDAIIAVTRGTLNLLNRDELQGVIAHEFGHISNSDMLISMRLAAMVMGFFFVLYLAMRIFQFTGLSDDRRDNNRKGGNPLVLAALILMVAGAITWFAGSILKSMVSRQREYLADASSVQFTRNPEGIANALRKIAGERYHDMPKTGMAFSHMYFEDTSLMSKLFATHPPIEKRIEAIEGRTYASEMENHSSSGENDK